MPSSPTDLLARLNTPKPVQNINLVTDPVRWAILTQLGKPQTVRDLSETLELKPGVVSYHLKRLMDLKVVVQKANPDRKNGVMFERTKYGAHIVITKTTLDAREG